ncbi:MAG: hypothetical protein ACOYKB_04350 [Succiniclasticum sp.]|jgi:hypothetical protein
MQFVDFTTVDPHAVVYRLLVVFILSFFVIIAGARIIGSENKARWFKRRTKYTFFNRRGIFGEYLNFGYPRTWQGLLTALIMYGIIFGIGIWYILIHPYA